VTPPRPLRVLVVSMWPSQARPEFGIFVQRQVEALRRAGVEVHVVPLREARSGRVRTPRKYLGLLLRTIGSILRRRPDLVHAHFLLPTGSIARAACVLTGTPLVVTAHGTDVRNAERMPVVRTRTLDVLRTARSVIAVSDQLAERIIALDPNLVDVEVLDMGIDTTLFSPGVHTPAETAPPLEGQITSGADSLIRLVCVASLLPNKNHAHLIRAVARVPEARLVCIGEGPAREALELLVQELGVHDRVAFTGRLAQDELVDWYRRMDAACLVSFDEGFGLSALEAVACACPVVVSATAPVAAIIGASRTGVVVDDPSSPEAIAEAIREVGSMERLDAVAVAELITGRSTDDRARELAALYARLASGQATA
jgi:glycosyltransferase involved in cell wall biosynthesis